MGFKSDIEIAQSCTMKPITEIAAVCGFQSIQYFSKYFKAVTGVTPKVYANNRK